MQQITRAVWSGFVVLAGCGAATPMTNNNNNGDGTEPAIDGDGEPVAADPGGGDDSGAGAEADALLGAHNRVRDAYCVPALTWSAELAATAQAWADQLRDNGCAFEHSRGNYGENLAAGTTGALDADGAVTMWADEVAQYDYANPVFGMDTGHFTQVVWRGTTQVGCGTSQCNGMTTWVCQYDPPGNWQGEFPANVPQACDQ